MLVAFDTSVLVAATLTHHQFNARAWPWVEAAELGKLDACICVHALAEVYSTLSKIPGAMTPAEVLAVVHSLPTVFRIRSTGFSNYVAAAARCAAHGLKSGSIFDALHLVDAEQAGADVLLTFNSADFARIVGPRSPKITVPPDPPSLQIPP